MNTRISCATGLSLLSSSTSIMRSSLGLEPDSSSVSTSCTSNSRALTIRKHTFSDEIDRLGIESSYLVGTDAFSSASQTSGLPSEGARQSPRGDSDPPDDILGPLGNAERLNWLLKKRRRNSSSQRWISSIE